MSIENDIRRMLADEKLREEAAHIDSARDILGLRETRTLNQILENQVLEDKSSFNFTLASLALVMAQFSIAAYLNHYRKDLIVKDPKAQQMAGINLGESEFNIAVYAQGLGTFITEATYGAVVNRIAEQQDTFLQDRLLTTEELQFFGVSVFLTSAELTNPDDHRVYPGDIEGIKHSYAVQKERMPQERFLRAIAFPNELRAAIGLEPLK